MKKIKIFQKKVIITFFIIIIIALISFGIYFYNKNNVKEVPVYNFSDIGMTDYWQDSNESDGQVKEDRTQSVYLSTTQQVDKILVKEGDMVKKGTPLIKYNTTLTALEVERKQIDINKMQLELDNGKKELEKILTYKPDVPIYGNPENIDNSSTNKEENSSNTTLNLSKPLPEVDPLKEMSPAPLTGSGTSEKPYIFLWEEKKEYNKEFISSLIERAGSLKTEVYAVFMIREGNTIIGSLKTATMLKFNKKSIDEYTFEIIKNYTDEDPLNPSDKIEEPELPIIENEIGPAYSANELKKMILDKEKEISEITVNIKVAQAELKKLKAEIEDTTVYSKIDGVIKTVLSLDDEEINSKPVIVVSGGGGYYITGRVSELALEELKVGQKVNVMSFQSGSLVEGEIKEISDIPYSGYTYFGMGNSNVSYYPYTVFVQEEGTLKEGEYVQLKPIMNQEGTSSIYLMNAFIVEENGKKVVYVANQDGKLEKRQITMNGGVYDYIKIKSGITAEDRIAFPYGKNVKEGAQVIDGSVEDLYSGL